MEVTFRRAYGPAIFGVALIWFCAGLAPGLTFEDSGELATAADLWGVPHPPGYAAWTLLAALWIRLLSFCEPIWTTNLLSAVLAAGAAVAVAQTAELWRTKLAPTAWPYITGALAALFLCAAPHVYRQAVITEVYGLHILVWSLFFYQVTHYWFAESPADLARALRRAAFLVGLAQMVHNLGILLLIAALATLALARFKGLTRREWGRVLISGFLGAVPLLYLPLAARADLGFTWGDTSSLETLWTHLSRKQYNYAFFRDPAELLEELRQQVIYIFEQYYLELVFTGACGLFFILFRRPRTGWLWVLHLLISGPLTALIINFQLDFRNQYAFQDATSLASVFYLQHYIYWAILMAITPAAVLVSSPRFPRALATATVLGLFALGGRIMMATYYQESKKDHRLTEELVDNLEALVARGERPSLILVNWDPFSFPLIYAQRVKNRFPETMVVDVEMLKAPWYQRYLERHYPSLRPSLSPVFRAYQDKYESLHQSVTGPMIRSLYLGLENYLKEAVKERNVYIALWRRMQQLPIAFPEGYEVRSAGSAGMLVKTGETARAVCPQALRISAGNPEKIKFDRLNMMIVSYYGELLFDMYEETSACPRGEIYSRLEGLAPFSTEIAEKIRTLPRP